MRHFGRYFGLIALFCVCLTPAWAQVAGASAGSHPLPNQIHTVDDGHGHKHEERGVAYRLKENKGQWHPNIRYQTDLPAGRLYFENNQFTYLFMNGAQVAALHPAPRETLKGTIDAHIYRVKFEGANPNPSFVSDLPFPDRENYFLGKDSKKWASDVQAFQSVTYKDLYSKIDLTVYSKESALKYDFRVAAGGNPDDIRLNYTGQDLIFIKNGRLHIKTTLNEVIEDAPYAYQIIDDVETRVPCEYKLTDGRLVSYDFPKGYDPKFALIIDPTLVFSTYTGSTSDNWGFTATYDKDGALYSGGIVAGPGFPVTQSGSTPISYDFTYGGGFGNGGAFNVLVYACDMAIIKYNPAGNQREYSTYVGGTHNEQPHSLIVNDAKDLFIFGTTRSNDYPATGAAYDKTFNGFFNSDLNGDVDIVVTRLNSTGSALLGSTYFGGSGYDGVNTVGTPLYHFYADDARGEIILDGLGNPIVITTTRSADIPTTPNAYQDQLNGLQDACVFKMDPFLTTLIYATYFGGESLETGYSSAFDSDGNLIFCGGTTSQFLPVSGDAWQPVFNGGTADGYVAILNPTGTSILNSTYIGTSAYDQVYFIDTDDTNNVFVMGQTAGNYPVMASKYNSVLGGNPNGGQFITKLKHDLSSPKFSTRFGAGVNKVNITPTAFLVDICDNVYVSGWGSPGLPDGDGLYPGQGGVGSGNTSGLPVTPDAYKPNTTGSDFYLFVLGANADSLLYATYFGGNQSDEHVDGGTSRFDKRGVVYQSVCASCGGFDDFPAVGTPAPYSLNNNSFNCNNASFKFKFDLIDAAFADYEYTVETNQGCAPFTVNFNNESVGALGYLWDFGDSTATSNEFEPTHVYTEPGIYEVKLSAINNGKCNASDETTQIIYVYATSSPGFEATQDPCGLTIPFTNTTINGTTYLWNFGDGSLSTAFSPSHTYGAAGTYNVSLIVNPGSLCADTVLKSVVAGAKPISNFSLSSAPCETLVTFTNGSANATEYLWLFGDQSTTNQANPTHVYPAAGTYTVKLIAGAGTPCPDTTAQQVTITPPADANFRVNPMGCVRTIAFFDSSSNASSYFWDFGDGGTSTDENPTHTYASHGFYTVKLIANPQSPACIDSITKQVYVPLLPNAQFQTPPPSCSFVVPFTNTSDETVSYLWDFGDNGTSTVANPTHTYAAVGTYEVTLIANPDSTCSDAFTQMVTILPVSVADFLNDTLICSRTISFVNNTQFGQTYEWDFADGSVSNQQSPTHTFLLPGIYPVKLTANKGTNCESSIIKNVHIRPLPSADFEFTTTVCSFTAKFQNNSSQATSYLWDFGDNNKSTLSNPSHVFPQSGTYEVTLITNADSVCPDAITKLVTIEGPSTANFALPDTITCDTILKFKNKSSNALIYQWTFGDGKTSNEKEPLHVFEKPGVYYVMLVTSPNSICPDTLRRRVEIKQRSKADFVLDATRCVRTVRFENRSEYAHNFIWKYDGKVFSNDTSPIFTFPEDRFYQITLIVDPDSLCPDSMTQNLFIGDNVSAKFYVNPIACDSIAFVVDSSLNATTYLWNMGDGTNYSEKNPPPHHYAAPGDYKVTLIVDLGTRCEKRLEKTVKVVKRPKAAFSVEQEPCGPLLTFTNESKEGVKFIWDFGFMQTEDAKPTLVFPGADQYDVKLIAFDQYGCADTASYLLPYDPLGLSYIYIPNAFTPNGDMVNDCFEIKGQNASCVSNVMIFDRWGNLIFETDDYKNCWNGTYNGGAVPESAYVFVITINHGFKHVGTVTVLR